ncbi:MAG: Arc family DNA-binding protein [Thermoleophilaceae bacterium]|nr:Arc family DNA-binding protein [Thermoleophilaceae bacterium]
MRQLTLRIPEQLAERLKQAARESGRSVNSYATAVLGAAVDPELPGDEAARVRERLARAGLLEAAGRLSRARPAEEALRRARRRAAKGPPLSELVSEGRR